MRRASFGLTLAICGAGCSLLDAPASRVETLTIRPEFGANLVAGDTSLRLRAIAIVADRPVPAVSAKWESSAPSIVAVTSSGAVSALAPGSAEVSATVQGERATTKITVLQSKQLAVRPAGPLSLEVGQTAVLSAVESDGPIFWDLAPVTWSTENGAIANVTSSGTVTALAVGTTNVVARSGTQTATRAITVIAPTAFSISPTVRTLAVGKTAQLTLTTNPPGPVPAVDWSSSNTAVAIVAPTGVVTGVAAGDITVTARRTAGGAVVRTASITVIPSAVASVSLTADSVLSVGRSVQLTAVPLDSSQVATSAPVSWLSSRPGVAVVSEDGVATGIRTGVSTISARSGGAVATRTITVIAASTSVPLDAVSAGGIHSCGRTRAGAAFCWGGNTAGELGDGSNDSRTLPTPVGGGIAFVSINAGFDHSCGLTATGTAYCWGDNSDGQLGDGTTVSRASPRLVESSLQFADIRAGLTHTCGLTTSGAAYCWGANGSGQLGDSSAAAMRLAPVRVAGGHTFSAIGVGAFHSCGIATGGTLYCWGGNAGAQIGDGTRALRRIPVRVSSDLAFTSLSVGFEHSCALIGTGAAYCWGRDFAGQVGNGAAAAPLLPVPVLGGIRFKQLTAGGLHSCGLSTNGAAYCWGANIVGQIGTGDAVGGDELVPVQVVGNLTFLELSAGFQHTCGRASTGVTYCWGDNASGQLGDGTRSARLVPTAVR